MTQSNTGGSPIETETLRRLVADATRGPWGERPLGKIMAGGNHIAHTEGLTRKETKANAALIALAPSLAAEMLALRAAAQRYLAANDAYDEDSKSAMDEWRAARMALMEALSRPDSGEGGDVNQLIWALSLAVSVIAACITTVKLTEDPRNPALRECTRGFPSAETRIGCAQAIFGDTP